MTTKPEAIPADVEDTAWNCDRWPEWLHAIVDQTNNVSDRLGMSTEQAIAYAVLADRASRAPVDGAEAIPVAWWIEADGEGASFFTRDSSLVGARKTSAEFTVTPLYTHPAPASPDVAKRCAEIADELSSDELFLDEKGRFGAELTAATIREEFNLPDTDGTAAPLAHRADAKVIRSGKTVQLNAEERADRDARGLHVEWAEGVGYHYFPSYDPKSVATAPASPDAEMVREMRETLEFYANPGNWASGRWVRGSEEDDDADEPVANLICIDHQIEEGCIAVPFADCGNRARTLLSKHGGDRS